VKLTKTQLRYWESYLATLSENERPLHARVEASHAGNRHITDGLLELYLIGKKTAGSSIVEDFVSAGDPIPQVGNFWIYLDSQDKPRLILRTDRVVFNKFSEVPLEIAIAEGEGDLSLAYWRMVHTENYSPFLEKWGVKSLEDATVVTEYFRIVYR
jgi:uncharacterized protein YhfF